MRSCLGLARRLSSQKLSIARTQLCGMRLHRRLAQRGLSKSRKRKRKQIIKSSNQAKCVELKTQSIPFLRFHAFLLLCFYLYMEHIDLVSKALSHMAWSLLLEGLLLIILGILVYMYPALVIILASVFFIIVGLTLITIGFKVKKYSKMTLDF